MARILRRAVGRVMPAHRPNDLPITSNPTPGPPRNSPISSLASNQLPRRRSCALAPAGLYRRDRTVAIAIARPAPARDQSSRAEPRLHTLGIGRYQQQLQSRKALAPRVRVGEPANARRACFRPHPQQTIYSGRVPSPSCRLRVRSRTINGRRERGPEPPFGELRVSPDAAREPRFECGAGNSGCTPLCGKAGP